MYEFCALMHHDLSYSFRFWFECGNCNRLTRSFCFGDQHFLNFGDKFTEFLNLLFGLFWLKLFVYEAFKVFFIFSIFNKTLQLFEPVCGVVRLVGFGLKKGVR